MKDRIKLIRTSNKLTQAEFASRLAISRSAVCKLESGENIPADRTIKLICNIFFVNYQWLVNGTGDMYNNDGDAQAIVDAAMNSDNDLLRRTLVAFAKQDESFWIALGKLIDEIKD